MATSYDCSLPATLLEGIRAARTALSSGELVVLPTDTVYGIAADAFKPEAVAKLLAAKGRDRTAPPPVLIPNVETMTALAHEISPVVQKLSSTFWPGALTIILPAQESLIWDLGETHGTVALRVPADPITLAILADTGPLAVSSANLHGQAAALNAADALEQLGESVEVYLDAGPSTGQTASTIIDATSSSGTSARITIVRQGAISAEQLRELLGDSCEVIVA
ncbi:MAG: L-threonylcarbamoyladenylate synthase [Microbacteriaceae bacterium]